ncbi:hypothetical protein [Microbacterium radiodurans]|uniref:Uncharacterized protein n=1 Tax=Microbacterium radiodurans TaxID=661398 RepID=A0A5J5ISV1_9MICO|nr:hypothetical protein [Microbacterium radiodurans]KAA9085069.1 hypothetical protein F6B42_11210 [Microbacterium radiodurans]
MKSSIRPVLSALAVAFTGYLAVAGTWWTRPVESPVVLVLTLVAYLAVTGLCIFWPSVPREPAASSTGGDAGMGRAAALPLWVALLGFAVALLLPSATWWGVGEEGRFQPFATWSLGGIGALMAILVVRRRYLVAWSGIAVMILGSIAWIGVPSTLSLGAVGSVIWVGGAQIIMLLTDRAAIETAELLQLQREASEWLATQEGRRRERRVRIQHALAVAGPVLSRTIAVDGDLDDEERLQARLAEGRLRDELRGPRLLDDEVRRGLEELRRGGANVTFLDEGGLDGLGERDLLEIRRELASVISGASSERIYIRTSTQPGVAVTIVGRSRGEDGDEDVDLWHEIARPAAR